MEYTKNRTQIKRIEQMILIYVLLKKNLYYLFNSLNLCPIICYRKILFHSIASSEATSCVRVILSMDKDKLVGQPILRLQEEIANTKANSIIIADRFFTLLVFIFLKIMILNEKMSDLNVLKTHNSLVLF